MGASSWHYYTPHRQSAEQALQELRQDVFTRGDYSMGMGGFAGPGGPFGGQAAAQNPLQLITAAANIPGPQGQLFRAAMSGDFTGLTDEERQAAEQLRPIIQMAQGGGFAGATEDEDEDDQADEDRPETIDELLEMVAEDGTHSILDIAQTGLQLDFGVAAPMPERMISEFFGSEQPTHEQVEENWADASDGLERWQAYYLTIYRNGQPHEYAFIGCSGD